MGLYLKIIFFDMFILPQFHFGLVFLIQNSKEMFKFKPLIFPFFGGRPHELGQINFVWNQVEWIYLRNHFRRFLVGGVKKAVRKHGRDEVFGWFKKSAPGIYVYLAILCDLFGMVKWPFQRINDLQLGDNKVMAWIIWYYYQNISKSLSMGSTSTCSKFPEPSTTLNHLTMNRSLGLGTPSQDASGKWRFSLGSPNLKMSSWWWRLHPGRGSPTQQITWSKTSKKSPTAGFCFGSPKLELQQTLGNSPVVGRGPVGWWLEAWVFSAQGKEDQPL